MNKIYIVQGSCGEYPDRYEWVVCCYHSEEKAAEIVEKLVKLQEYNEDYKQLEYAEFETPYRLAHPLHAAPCYSAAPKEMQVLQQACSHGNGTPAMKDEYRRLQKLHIQNLEAAKVAYREFDTRRHAYEDELETQRKVWFADNYKPAEELLEVVPFIPMREGYRGPFTADNRYSYYDAELR